MSRILYESHMHTPLCKHATGLPGEYAEVAWRRGLKGIIVTCHNPIPGGYNIVSRMAPEQFSEYVRMIDEAREQWAGRLDVRMGLECDFAPGHEAWLKELLGSHTFHHVLGSIHPQVGDYKSLYFTGDSAAYIETYFDHLAMAAETGLYDTLAHPDLIKNENPAVWDLDRVMPIVCRALDRIAATGTAMELNTSGRNKRLPEMNPNPTMLREMRERDIPVVIGADAHIPGRVADYYEQALDLMASVGYEHVSLFLDRKRQDIPIAEARASLQV